MSDAVERKAQAEAAAWMVKLYSDERTADLEAGLREWLAADPRNSRHFEDMTHVWELGGTVSADGLPRVQRRGKEQNRSTANWRGAVATMAVVISALGVFVTYPLWSPPRYATDLGEQRIVMLNDGSRIILNSRTQLKVQFTDTERRVELMRGEAFFEVAKDAARLFTVTAGQRRVTALGTSFNVRYELNSTAVTLVEGRVQVTETNKSAQHGTNTPALLARGQRLTFTGEKPSKLDSPRIEAVTAWRRGEVLFDNNTLSEAVAEMNRYDERQLVIDESELAHLRVSGIYRSGDSASFARGVGELHGVRYTVSPGKIHLHR